MYCNIFLGDKECTSTSFSSSFLEAALGSTVYFAEHLLNVFEPSGLSTILSGAVFTQHSTQSTYGIWVVALARFEERSCFRCVNFSSSVETLGYDLWRLLFLDWSHVHDTCSSLSPSDSGPHFWTSRHCECNCWKQSSALCCSFCWALEVRAVF